MKSILFFIFLCFTKQEFFSWKNMITSIGRYNSDYFSVGIMTHAGNGFNFISFSNNQNFTNSIIIISQYEGIMTHYYYDFRNGTSSSLNSTLKLFSQNEFYLTGNLLYSSVRLNINSSFISDANIWIQIGYSISKYKVNQTNVLYESYFLNVFKKKKFELSFDTNSSENRSLFYL